MKGKKVLFITQEIMPYVQESAMAISGRNIPQSIQEAGAEIRTFMPRWGNINERRNQLHEVIRLSGINIIIDDTDHPLIIKVSSIPSARMQVYFIDNDDYFHKRQMMTDENGEEYEDNAERAIFYARGVLEAVKKSRWCPDVIHCHGWMSALAPLYVKAAYREDPSFANTKVVFSVYDEFPQKAPHSNFLNTLLYRDVNKQLLEETGIDLNSPNALRDLAIMFSDGIVQGQEKVGSETIDLAKNKDIPVLEYPGMENLSTVYGDFYKSLL
jgi:starch synthase